MKSYFRFLSRNKLYTLINIAGLVVSLMFIILMGDYTWRQSAIDSWHKNADRIYLTGNEKMFYMWPQAAEEIKNQCPEVEKTCCVLSADGRIKYGQQEVKSKDAQEGIIMLADSTFFKFFDFELVKGDRLTALDAPDKCVITEQLAKRLFGSKDPIGESLQIVGNRHVHIVDINGTDPYDSTLVYTISAVAKDLDHTVLPNETQVIASMARYPQVAGYRLEKNSFANASTGAIKAFLMQKPSANLVNKRKQIQDYLQKNYTNAWGSYELSLTPLTDVIFAPQNEGLGMIKGDKTRLQILLAAVLAILFFAISNYINLTVANTGFRAKEMATRKLFGSSQHDISLKLIVESTLMVAFCFVVGFALACCFQDDASALFKGKIALLDDIRPSTIGVSLGFVLLTGIISGIMPSWQLSHYQPIDIVKGSFRFRSKMVLGKVFVILQNVITVTMLTSALVIWLQLNHLIHAPLGYNTKNLYYVYAPQGQFQAARSLLEKMPFVEEIGVFQNTTFSNLSWSSNTISRGDKKVNLLLTDMDSTTFRLYGLEVLKDYGLTDGGYYLNEEAMRQLDYTDKDREIDWGGGQKRPIAGILRDFHRVNVLQDVQPFAIRLQDNMEWPGFLVKTNGDKKAKTAFIEMVKDLGCPESEAKWLVCGLEESIADTFEDHQNTLDIISLFTLIAIVISVMGYMGLSIFFIRQRQKEIAIRKVMGSTSGEVLLLMLRTFSIPMLISFVIAVPISWYIMRDWLSNFSYRIALSPWIFTAAGFTCFIISLLTVIVQSWRAASENPINNIKTE
ncbi:MAG: FtsX-like permease family protein [Prevotella sp.]|nr:FtsX-like permease family protein [Prevotella sp.]